MTPRKALGERNKTEYDSKARRKPGFVFDKCIEASRLSQETGPQEVISMSTQSGFRPLRSRKTTEPEVPATVQSEQPVTAEQMGIKGGQGRTGEEVRGSGRVMKWIAIATLILIIATFVAMPLLSK